MNDTPFPGAGDPFGGLSPNLVPNPPPAMPGASEPGDGVASLSPFKEALDVDTIIKNLVLDRPLSLFIPNKHLYPDWEFHIINSVPKEMAAAQNQGWRQITDPELTALFTDLVAGHDKDGKTFRPLLMARPKRVGEIVRERNRQQLASLYAGMDPKNKELSGKYTDNETSVSKAKFEGDAWRIRVKAPTAR